MARDYVYASRVKEAAKAQGLRMAGDAVDAINKAVDDMLRKAGSRAKGNGRKTIQAQDI